MSKVKKLCFMAMACVMLAGSVVFFTPSSTVTVHAATMTNQHCPNSGCQAYLFKEGLIVFCRECGYVA